MTVPLRTIGFLGLAVAMLGAGYLFVPSPGAASLPTPATKATAAAPTPAAAAPAAAAVASKPASTLVVNRAPVPLLAPAHHNYYVLKETGAKETAAAAASDKAKTTIDMGTFTANSLSPTAQPGADAKPADTQQALAVDTKPGADAKARAAVEQDGYRNVSGLVKNADGTWRGRAMRGRTEIGIRVNADGSVSQD